ncbi:MAG TPA: TOPRIM nucleotidyl transferase/hydrolase domain-containing protein [Longimicrobium sp.]|nr:TOPRIM nucleotidyl transferase/hydrolase domain-containing protein [Longimicrobium sp.]
MSEIHTLVLVEGESDAAAIRALAGLFGYDLEAGTIRIHPAGGVTNFSRLLANLARTYPHASFRGLYDIAEERHVRRALASAAIPDAAHAPLESFGFFACVADLEDELIRALGAEAVQHVLEAQGELAAFRRFQAMPHHRHTPVDQQLRRFLGTQATRKIRCARSLAERLDPDRLPRPLMQLAATLFDAP